MATKKQPGTQVILWEQEMKAAAVKQAAGEKVFEGFKRVQIQGGCMMIDGEAVPGNELDVVVLAAAPLNEFYKEAYNPAKPTVPDCYAYGDPTAEDPEEGMGPKEVEDKQADKCADCWANVMGSADVGRGKACKNIKRLLLTTPDELEDPKKFLKEAEMRSLSIPVMSVKFWAKYVKEVLGEQLQRPYYAVVTTVSVKPDPKSQFTIHFEFKELVNFDQELWDAMKAKHSEALKAIVAPYPRQADLDAASAAQTAPRGRPGAKAPAGRPGAVQGRAGAKAPAAAKKAKF